MRHEEKMIHKKEKKQSAEIDPYVTMMLRSANITIINVLKDFVAKMGR